ncbi:MAG: LamG domain-containing protein, partial [Sedimentisphaerales bacterium]|nr:LamG domain-containing protein [Sedimentisphaerales bacterium]
LIGSLVRTPALNTEDTVHIGQRGDTGEAVNFFPGKVDDVKIWNRALTGAQIAWLAGRTSTFSIPADLHQDGVINFKDFAKLADSWLEEILWP